MSLRSILFSLSASLASATNLYATHYSGTVYSLSLTHSSNGSDLAISSEIQGCGPMPSWLTLDPATRIIYCNDETGDASTNGSLNALSASTDGTLKLIASTDAAPGGGVNSVIYTGEHGAQYLAIAHYGGSALSTFTLPLTPDSQPLQVFRYTFSDDNPKRRPQQDSPHPHQVFLDPTGSFVLVPDLGSDLLRVYAIDKATGKLQSHCTDLSYPTGSGPRHGLFWESADDHHSILTTNNNRNTRRTTRRNRNQAQQQGAATLYTANELDGHLKVFDVSYVSDGCLSFRQLQALVPYPTTNDSLPTGATLAEIRKAGNGLYVSVRSDHGFAPYDSIATLTRHANATVEFERLSSAYGTVPRTFVINKAGDLVAIGDQASSNVAIVARDPVTGVLGDKIAELQVGEPGAVGTAEGLSSIIWDE
ncbi:3-carboxy-cis,cis-mucoante lactonizing enzyme [Aspergillus aculeatinus CBS 121060]|uniref:3-carboxy-cis,cis-mucoante lactonizing enzyme n=1 Tax=Aspergillus aculeatinus CBS 121060 TaxID=1448322 RepID=A0ACD1H0R1_9EURO|nr:3-carboxy-cis,cis-mucoante lactonizing enzyme [Aspergillus aculeatinus CBS 121060]RAH67122.1 3-carboxy-cis,cis-mucoante lactonizing enzyme [Aspergillus aculeatinus CBS 121060]